MTSSSLKEEPSVTSGLRIKKFDDIYRNRTSANNVHMRVYKKEDTPAEYHWKHNRRIPPIFVDPDVEWVIRTERSKTRQGNWTVGDHGWPALRSKTYSVFFERGPAFQKGIAGSVTFQHRRPVPSDV